MWGCSLFPNALDFLMLALATWRVAVFLVREDGPFQIARRIRERAGIRHDEDTGEPNIIPETTLAQALSCVWCTSFWTAIILTSLWLSAWGAVVVLVLAMAGAAVLLDVAVGRVQR